MKKTEKDVMAQKKIYIKIWNRFWLLPIILVGGNGIIVCAILLQMPPALMYVLLSAGIIAHSIAIYYLARNVLNPVMSLCKHIIQTGDEEYLRLASSPKQIFTYIMNMIGREAKAQILKTQAEMRALQNQINPHFLYNTLETIRSHAIAYKIDDIAEMTEALATLFRYGISRPGEMSTLEQELKNVKNYLIIQKYRFGDKIQVKWELEDEERIQECLLPSLTIQPVVENAIHHGLERKIGKGNVTIRAFTTQSKLMIQISDDGIGIPQEKLKKILQSLDQYHADTESTGQGQNTDVGIALINVNQRLKFYFGPEYGINITSIVDCGTMVEISLPKT